MAAPTQTNSAAAQFHKQLDSDWNYWLAQYPEFATQLGRTEYDTRWTDYSAAAIDARAAYLRASVKSLSSVARASLSAAGSSQLRPVSGTARERCRRAGPSLRRAAGSLGGSDAPADARQPAGRASAGRAAHRRDHAPRYGEGLRGDHREAGSGSASRRSDDSAHGTRARCRDHAATDCDARRAGSGSGTVGQRSGCVALARCVRSLSSLDCPGRARQADIPRTRRLFDTRGAGVHASQGLSREDLPSEVPGGDRDYGNPERRRALQVQRRMAHDDDTDAEGNPPDRPRRSEADSGAKWTR